MKFLHHILLATLVTVLPVCSVAVAQSDNPQLILKTNMGDMKIELFAKEAPVSTKNFLEYTKSKFFEGTIFHRVIDGFMIQGGGFSQDMKKKETLAAIKNEAGNGLKNEKYTLAMARTDDPNSATSQFFVNTSNNEFLNREKSQDGVGYAVFGKVIEGQEVVDKIGKVATTRVGPYSDVPAKPVIITAVELVDKSKK